MNNVVIRPTSGNRPLNVIGDAILPLVTAADGTGYELFDLSGPAESGPPPHSHPWAEAYYVLDGEVAVEVDGDRHVAGPGHVVHIPADRMHCYKILTPSARFLVLTSPEGAGAFFADVDANVGAMPASLPTLIEVAKRNRLTSPLFAG